MSKADAKLRCCHPWTLSSPSLNSGSGIERLVFFCSADTHPCARDDHAIGATSHTRCGPVSDVMIQVKPKLLETATATLYLCGEPSEIFFIEYFVLVS